MSTEIATIPPRPFQKQHILFILRNCPLPALLQKLGHAVHTLGIRVKTSKGRSSLTQHSYTPEPTDQKAVDTKRLAKSKSQLEEVMQAESVKAFNRLYSLWSTKMSFNVQNHWVSGYWKLQAPWEEQGCQLLPVPYFPVGTDQPSKTGCQVKTKGGKTVL